MPLVTLRTEKNDTPREHFRHRRPKVREMTAPDTPDDGTLALLERARKTLAAVYSPRHRTACALRTTDGNVYTGVHLDTAIGTASVHAEAVAVADAREAGDGEVATVVSVSHPGTESGDGPTEAELLSASVIPPCGTCRELLYEYGPTASVVVSASPAVETVPVAELLPEVPWHTGW